jgi:hypothetical protein
VHSRDIILLLAVLLGPISSTLAASADPLAWPGFQIIMWQTKTARQYQALKALGVTAAMVPADRVGETPASATQKVFPIIQAGLRPYVENIATDFFSAYHRWFLDKGKNAAFLALQRTLAANPSDKSVFIRRPGLSDPRALGRIEKRLTDIVRIYAPHRPLFFDLGDETGIADLSAAWDFDFSVSSLAGMRLWLKEQYGTLAALNSEWGTHFVRWRDVMPPTTTQTMMRTDGNYAAWSDFKRWMDVAHARAIEGGAQAVHAGAPWARAAIEGAQMPGWGGYDYTRLAPAVDVMELYDAGQSLDLAQAFNPRLMTLVTVNWAQPGALHRSWRELLRGVRGMVLWDPNDRFVNPDGSLGPDGRLAAPFLAEMQMGPAALILASQRVRAPIAVLYSPQSYRLQWLLDHRAMGASWTRLSSEDENADNAVRAARRRVLGLLDRLGLSPHFVSEKEIAEGQLEQAHDKIVILPQTLALSAVATRAIRTFIRSGGILVTDGQTGLFDGHGRRLARPRLSELLDGINPRAISLSSDDGTATYQLAQILKAGAITPDVTIADGKSNSAVGIEHYLYRNGSHAILALLADPAADEEPRSTTARLSLLQPAYIYDIRAKRLLGHVKQISVAVESSVPTVLALSATALSAETCQSLLHWQTCLSLPDGTAP